MKENTKIENIRHSLAHILAYAVKEKYPDVKFGIGPVIENGFYYDFQFSSPISEQELQSIEKIMRNLVNKKLDFTGKKITPEQAKKTFKSQPFKMDLIKEFTKEKKQLSEYAVGDFADLCKGGHVKNTSEIDPLSFKLTKVAGAYWRGSEKNPMLTRIYGIAFGAEKELTEYIAKQEEAEKRDHRLLGEKMDLFTISEQVGKGLPLFTPKGAILRKLLNDYSQELRRKYGWQEVWSPHITKDDLYKTSGHWDKFGDELFLVKSQETSDQMVLKPMNCPHHQQIYASKPRSYKDLPIKYMETTTVYRDEKSGELLGLSRVRCITQDDSHTFCLPEQIEAIYQELIDITKAFYGKIGMKIKARLSFQNPKTPEEYLGDPKLWKKAQRILLDIAKKNQLDYFVAEGEAAFYGPKIDFMAIDALGREWQLATPQLDFVQPERFALTYQDQKGKPQTPVMIHFALMGSIERFLAMYIEHTGGHFPLWLAPEQIWIIPISESHKEYAKGISQELSKENFRVVIKDENETLGKKIREGETQRIPYLLIIGDKEVNSTSVSPRNNGKDLGATKLEDFIQRARKELDEKS